MAFGLKPIKLHKQISSEKYFYKRDSSIDFSIFPYVKDN